MKSEVIKLLDEWVASKHWSQWWNNDAPMKNPTWKKLNDVVVNLTPEDFESFARFTLVTTKKTQKQIREQQERIDKHTTHSLIKDTITSVKVKCAKEFVKDLNKIANDIIIHNENGDTIFVSDNETLIDRINFLKENYNEF